MEDIGVVQEGVWMLLHCSMEITTESQRNMAHQLTQSCTMPSLVAHTLIQIHKERTIVCVQVRVHNVNQSVGYNVISIMNLPPMQLVLWTLHGSIAPMWMSVESRKTFSRWGFQWKNTALSTQAQPKTSWVSTLHWLEERHMTAEYVLRIWPPTSLASHSVY